MESVTGGGQEEGEVGVTERTVRSKVKKKLPLYHKAPLLTEELNSNYR